MAYNMSKIGWTAPDEFLGILLGKSISLCIMSISCISLMFGNPCINIFFYCQSWGDILCKTYINKYALGVVAEWSKVLIAVCWPLMVWSTFKPWEHTRSGSYPGSFHLYISFNLTLWVACIHLESPLTYNMYLFNPWSINHINKDIIKRICLKGLWNSISHTL